MATGTNKNIILPENYDPYDMRLKIQFHPQADHMNMIAVMRKNPTLCCGAVKNGKPCRQVAGAGTKHLGYGRCRLHGGNNTGPKTPEGKARAIQNNRTHGLYAKTLLPEEQEIFDQLQEAEPKSLEYEISLQKTKIISYLTRQREKFEKDREKEGDEIAYRKSKVYYSEGENGGRSYYHAGTIEDRALDRALNTLRRLVEAHNRMHGDEKTDDIMDAINNELRAASKGQVSISWGGNAQAKSPGNSENSE